MTIVCPNCDARFRDPPQDVAEDRAVQCSKCEHEWIRDDDFDASRISVEAPSIQPDMRALLDDQRDAIQTTLPVTIENTTQKETKRAPLYVDRDPETVLKKRSMFMPATLLTAVAIIAGGIFAKDIIIEKIPQAQSAYQAAGLISPSPELEIGDIQTTRTVKDGIARLIIRGEIENTASHELPVPALKLTMRGESNVRLYAWTVSAAKDQLKAGERSRFTAIAQDYPGEAVNVEVEFMPPKDKK